MACAKVNSSIAIEAMCETNVFMAKKLLDLLLENPPEAFFCVSTDKAANPVNVMGATKEANGRDDHGIL